MPAVYFPDVSEFQPFVSALSKRSGVRNERSAGYVAIKSDQPIEISRSETGLEEALWFGGLVGGFEGEIATFDAQMLKIV